MDIYVYKLEGYFHFEASLGFWTVPKDVQLVLTSTKTGYCFKFVACVIHAMSMSHFTCLTFKMCKRL